MAEPRQRLDLERARHELQSTRDAGVRPGAQAGLSGPVLELHGRPAITNSPGGVLGEVLKVMSQSESILSRKVSLVIASRGHNRPAPPYQPLPYALRFHVVARQLLGVPPA